MASKKTTHTWTRGGGKWVLNVDGSFNMSGGRYSLARYSTNHGLFDVYAFFESDKKINEPYVEHVVGRRLQELFNCGKYICVTENGTGKRIDRKFVRLEFYAFCDKPDPKKVGMIKDIVADYIKN